jgi:predicted RNase H-like HicB family nuclease
LLFHVISKAWVGISDDVPGLYVGAGTLEELMQTANELIPELLILNGVLPHERQPELEGAFEYYAHHPRSVLDLDKGLNNVLVA